MPLAASPPRTKLLGDAQQQAEAAAATLIERKFKEPANLEVSVVLGFREEEARSPARYCLAAPSSR